ncbi:methyltransferase domain-containing protein [candidate division WOR-3 bacterium]|uniref:Methyltransferase domain-containing protein n=1 Tax=candidate division WOR-3 bacterium TaxID=2052148 RepID=A0A9D5QC78_UNCW3|nr:methyltransferase domain-containing protein [candidate division WOR-3 bacterium]MBD3364244.1 methyltransferase domain-containing protein [candidate division WOR-3 bacterium]
MVWVIVILAVIAVVCVVSIEIKVRHKPSLEGIEDASAVKAYDRLSQMPQFAAMRGIFVNELKRHNPSGILADVGCGPGYLLNVLASRFPHLNLLGVDISREILAKARDNLTSFANIDFKLAGSQGLPFAANSLDFVVSTLSLHHWSEPSASFREFHRVLRPEGQFLIFDLRRNPPILFHLLMRVITPLVVPRVLTRIAEPLGSLLASFTPAEVEDIIKGTPFREFEVKKGFFWLFAWGRKG